MAYSRKIIRWRTTFRIGVVLAGLCASLKISAALPLDPPEGFFADVAGRLLEQQLGMRLTEIQIAPTNQYSAAVHRIFQIAANIYDATSTNDLPTVFRPLFTTNASGTFLGGFTNDNSVSTLGEWIASNPCSVPMVIAARKGFPNFNEFAIRSDITVTRKLQVVRDAPARPGVFPVGTNQMYLLGISNYFGLEAWNSSAFRYPRPATITVSNFATMWMSNDFGIQTGQVFTATTVTNLAASAWRGAAGLRQGVQTVSNSFLIPFSTNQVFLSNAVYVFTGPNGNRFVNVSTNVFETDQTFKVPYWVFTISNHVTYLMSESNRIVDFAFLNDSQVVDLHRDIVGAANPYMNTAASAALANLWNTNRNAPDAPTAGIIEQAHISLGTIPTANSEWRSFALTQTANENDKQAAIDAFRIFCGLSPQSGNPVQTNLGLTMETPFNPSAKLAAVSTWQANDPLVHYTTEDLIGFPGNTNRQYLKPTQSGTNIVPASLGRVNESYSPWGGKFNSSAELPDSYDRSLKDAVVYGSDDWQFPTNESLAAGWLGRVHRGTPWQTIYLKADVAPTNTWLQYRGDLRTHSTNDWRMAALLASLLNTNDVRALTSVNTTNFSSWAATLAGLTVLSNITEFPIIEQPPQFETNVIAADAPQIATIVDGINRTRTAQRGQYFVDSGTFLSVPELSSASPWLNLSDSDQLKWGLTDEAYEMLPSQLLSLVRADTVVTAMRAGNSIELRFTAFDGYGYRVESSGDLATWATVSEPHYPTNGVFTLTLPANSGPQFFRALLLP